MSYCINPTCPQPDRPGSGDTCQQCHTPLKLQDRYVALQLIGQGGFGKTLLAEDRAKPSKPRCVIKIFAPQGHGDLPKASELFQQEATRLDDLGHHDQIPELLAYAERGNSQYIVQQFIPGQNLKDSVSTTGLFKEAQLRQFFLDLLPVLQFCHDRQVIHRDIKPQNIIRRTTDQKLVLVDFGAAKYAASETQLVAMSQTLVGSAEYLAPEQAKRRGTYASDLYSLGVTALHLLTGASPWDLESDESFGQWHWREFAQAQGTVLSSNLAAIIDRLIAKSLSDRFRTATEALDALQGTGTGANGGTISVPVKTQGLDMGAPPPTPKNPVEILNLPLPNGQGTIEFVKIPPGVLRMDQGSLITLKGFYMAKYPITQRQYSAVMNNNPSRFKGDLDRPVECVSWSGAVKFCEIFNAQSNLNRQKIRLPSETQWEYACRAGTNTKFWFGNDDKDLEKHAWYSGNSRKGKGLILGLVGGSTHSVYERAEAHTNPWGLVDMHGHVWEWCQDKWVEEVEKLPKDGTSFNGWTLFGGRAVRGGSWYVVTVYCRSVIRNNCHPDGSSYSPGFRVVLLLS